MEAKSKNRMLEKRECVCVEVKPVSLLLAAAQR